MEQKKVGKERNGNEAQPAARGVQAGSDEIVGRAW